MTASVRRTFCVNLPGFEQQHLFDPRIKMCYYEFTGTDWLFPPSEEAGIFPAEIK